MPENEITPRALIAKLCKLQAEVVSARLGYDRANDCFCGQPSAGGKEIEEESWRSSGEAVDYIIRVVRHSLYHRPEVSDA